MSSQDRLENVLRDIHVMISKSETYDTDRIIVSKQDIFNLIIHGRGAESSECNGGRGRYDDRQAI